MNIPESFKKAQRQAFQDKTISWHKPKMVTDNEGATTTRPSHHSNGNFQVNVQIISDKLIAEPWGLTIGRDLQVTCSDPLPMTDGDYIKYGSDMYKVVSNIPHDSHSLLLAQKEM